MSALGFLSPPFKRHAQRDLLVYLAMAAAGVAGSGPVAAQAPQANPAAPARSTTATAPGNAAVPAAAPAPSAAAAPPVANAGAANPFDAQRKAWPDRIPPVPPPPPPPPPAVVTDQDLQLYGVVIVGSVKMANVRLGQRFASAAVEGRAFSSLREGQVLGEFTLAQIHPTHVVLSAPGGQQSIYFTKKTDRASGPAPAAAVPVAQNQAPVQGATPVTPQAGDATQAAAPPAAVPGANANQAAQQQAAAAAAQANPPAANSPNTANTVFNSLSEALSAARNNANMQQNQGANPFQIPSTTPKQ